MSVISGGIQLFASDVLTTSSEAQHQLGTLGATVDGRLFRYGKAGASNLAAGKLMVAATQEAQHENMACAATAAGESQVTVTLGSAAVTANQYAGGYLVINDVDGEGNTYLVSGHPAADSAATLVVTLAQPLVDALTANSQASLILNPWASVVISATDQADMAVGVPNCDVTAAYFCWLQTRGVCSVLADETLTAGAALTIGTGVAGAVEVLDAAGEPQIGVAIQAGVDTEYRAAYLQLD